MPGFNFCWESDSLPSSLLTMCFIDLSVLPVAIGFLLQVTAVTPQKKNLPMWIVKSFDLTLP